MYPTLEQLVEDGLVRQAKRADGKVYALTPAGEAYVETHRDNLEARCEAITACDGGGIRELRSSAGQLMLEGGETLPDPLEQAELYKIVPADRRDCT